MEDKDSILWVGTSDGLFRFNPAEPAVRIIQYRYVARGDKDAYFVSQPVNRLCEDSSGLLWMSCNDWDGGIYKGLRTFNKESEAFQLVDIDSSFSIKEGMPPSEFVIDILIDRQGIPWFGTSKGLSKFNSEQNTFKTYVPFPGDSKPLINDVTWLFEDSKGNLITSTIYGQQYFKKHEKKFGNRIILDRNQWFNKQHAQLFAAAEDQNGYLWIRINESLIRILPEPDGSLDPGIS